MLWKGSIAFFLDKSRIGAFKGWGKRRWVDWCGRFDHGLGATTLAKFRRLGYMSALAVNEVIRTMQEFLRILEHDGVKQSLITLAFRPPLLTLISRPPSVLPYELIRAIFELAASFDPGTTFTLLLVSHATRKW